jgi:hypothetical protein
MMKFKDLIKDLEIDERYTKTRNFKQKVFNSVKNNISMIEDYNFMADLLFLPETKEKYKYLLVCVDLASNEFDMEPLRTKDSAEVAKAFQSIMKRDYLNFPKVIRTDAGTEFKDKVNKLFQQKSTLHKVALPKRHRQMSNVESLNKLLARLFNGYMNMKEKATGKVYKEWTDILEKVRVELNKIRKIDINKDVSEYDYPAFDPASEAKFKVGDMVHEKLDHPENFLGKKQPTENFRVGDVKYSMVPKRIEKIIYMNDYPYYRYMLSGIKNASYSEYELIKSRFKEERYKVKDLIDKRTVGRRIEYLVWWLGYKKKESTWEPRANLIRDGFKDYIDRYEEDDYA